jgi:Na+/citrate or Na+/malate symporter
MKKEPTMMILMSYREQCELMDKSVPILFWSIIGLVVVVALFQSKEKRSNILHTLSGLVILFMIGQLFIFIGKKIFGSNES